MYFTVLFQFRIKCKYTKKERIIKNGYVRRNYDFTSKAFSVQKKSSWKKYFSSMQRLNFIFILGLETCNKKNSAVLRVSELINYLNILFFEV